MTQQEVSEFRALSPEQLDEVEKDLLADNGIGNQQVANARLLLKQNAAARKDLLAQYQRAASLCDYTMAKAIEHRKKRMLAEAAAEASKVHDGILKE